MTPQVMHMETSISTCKTAAYGIISLAGICLVLWFSQVGSLGLANDQVVSRVVW